MVLETLRPIDTKLVEQCLIGDSQTWLTTAMQLCNKSEDDDLTMKEADVKLFYDSESKKLGVEAIPLAMMKDVSEAVNAY
jgi:hypothetical protein